MTAGIVHSDGLQKRLYECGLVPDHTRRVIIDIQVGHCTMVYYERFADSETVDLVLDHLLANPKEFKLKPVTSQQPPEPPANRKDGDPR